MRTALAWLLLPAALLADDLPRQASEILRTNCLQCHGAVQMAKLDLRSRETMLKGGERGAALVPGDPNRSLLYRFAAHFDKPAMPPGGKLQDWEITVLRNWINTGAPLDGKVDGEDDRAALAKLEDRPITDEERRFWAFQPVGRPEPPRVRDGDRARNPIDAFLLHAMEERGLTPSPEADRRTLVRRAYLDVTGLPPSPEEVEAFVNDRSAGAWEKLVDGLLASPHYGERWARHWLDVVRYADSGGFEYDRDWPNAYRYRDYIVRSLNQDKPFDRFIREQIAGDEIAPGSHDALIATGFLRFGPEANIKSEQTRMDELDDILSTTANTFLGMTVGCARCHDHKFDPIAQKDYYRMQAVFFPSKAVDALLVDAEEIARHKEANARVDAAIEPFKKQRAEIEKPYRERILDAKKAKLPNYIQAALRTPPEQRTEGQELNARQVEKTLSVSEEELTQAWTLDDAAAIGEIARAIAELEKTRPAPLPAAMAVAEDGPRPRNSYFLHRGSPDQKGSAMQPGVLSVLAREEWAFPEAQKAAASSLRRKAFAGWLASPDNPLPARVKVNRLWQHHFGEGIVRTPNNFGKTGDKPSHPELLDWLASEFVSRGWSLKQMHRLMLTSRAYRMASDDIAANAAKDPDNRLLWRMPRRRIEAEGLRDAMLAVAGNLDRTVGGPAVHPYIDPSLFQGSSKRTWEGKPVDDPSTWRRSLYVFSKRSIPLPMLEVFDKPDSIGSCARRNRSTIPTQALALMNNEFSLYEAEKFAARLRKDAGTDPGRQAERAFLLAFARPPAAAERAAAVEFIRSSDDGLADFCLALFNSNEFAYLP
ncbi:MAG: PSD1 domain-containing protein [Bryobacterales bacterium]|nr:PSD1 domain-containing protein [Bryobacterales bacterium]